MALDEDTVNDVIATIKEDGADITFNQVTIGGGFDPLTFLPTDTIVPYEIKAVITKFKANELPLIVLAGDIKVLLDATHQPTKADSFIINGDAYGIENIETVYSKNSPVLYICLARK